MDNIGHIYAVFNKSIHVWDSSNLSTTPLHTIPLDDSDKLSSVAQLIPLEVGLVCVFSQGDVHFFSFTGLELKGKCSISSVFNTSTDDFKVLKSFIQQGSSDSATLSLLHIIKTKTDLSVVETCIANQKSQVVVLGRKEIKALGKEKILDCSIDSQNQIHVIGTFYFKAFLISTL